MAIPDCLLEANVVGCIGFTESDGECERDDSYRAFASRFLARHHSSGARPVSCQDISSALATVKERE